MTRVVRNAALFLVAGILVASAAVANVPDPAHSTLSGSFIDVAGLNPSGVPDPCEAVNPHCPDYSLTVRDFANNPVANATVVVDFSACPDIQISSSQVGRSPGQLPLCPKQVQATTSATGTVTFTIQGRALNNTAPGTYTASTASGGAGCAQILANGVLLAPAVFVSAYDLDGLSTPIPAVSPGDISKVAAGAAAVLVGGPNYARMDVNHSGNLTPADASREASMAAEALGAIGTGSTSTAPFCP